MRCWPKRGLRGAPGTLLGRGEGRRGPNKGPVNPRSWLDPHPGSTEARGGRRDVVDSGAVVALEEQLLVAIRVPLAPPIQRMTPEGSGIGSPSPSPHVIRASLRQALG